jgi:hypothetical protein
MHTHRQKAFLLAQHLYAYNTALSFSDVHDQAELTAIIGKQFVGSCRPHDGTRAAALRTALAGKRSRAVTADLIKRAVDFCDAIRRSMIRYVACCNQIKQMIDRKGSLALASFRRLLRF